MNSNKYNAIFVSLLFVCLLWTNKLDSKDVIQQQENVLLCFSRKTDTANYIKCHLEDSLFCTSIQYINKNIYVLKNEDTVVKVPYSFPYPYLIFPVNGLIISDDTIIYDYYIYKDQFLLLPVNEVNNRQNLIVIDLLKKQYLEFVDNADNYLIESSAGWFYLDKKSGYIIGSCEINPDGKTPIVYYIIKNGKIKRQKSKLVFLDWNIHSDYKQFRNAVHN